MVNRTGRSPFALPRLAAFVITLAGLIVLGNCTVLAQGFAATITEPRCPAQQLPSNTWRPG